MKASDVKKVNNYKCHNCGYKGECYGQPICGGRHQGVTAPWCPVCELNNKLEWIRPQQPSPYSD